MPMSSNENKDYETMPITFDKKLGLPLWKDVRTLPIKYTIAISKIREFFDGLEEGRILATRCKHCGKLYFPPQADCPNCRKDDMEWVELSGEAELETYTIIKAKPKTFAHYEDYVLAIGKLKEGIKVLAWLRIKDQKEIRVGMKMRLVVAKRMPEGYLTYEFVPA